MSVDHSSNKAVRDVPPCPSEIFLTRGLVMSERLEAILKLYPRCRVS